MELRALDASHDELLRLLEEQEDVWEQVGPLPEPGERGATLFAIVEGGVPVGIGGFVTPVGLDSDDRELLCIMRSEAQARGLAKHACQLLLAWAFQTAGLERVVACIDNANEGARSLAGKLGMRELAPLPPNRTVYVKYRDPERAPSTR